MNNQEELTAAAAALCRLGEKVLSTETNQGAHKSSVDETSFHDFRISALSFFSRVFGEKSEFYQSFKMEVTQATASRTRRGISMLNAASRELQGNWLETTRGALTREILTDMLRLAQDHTENGNHRAAAIVAGAVLEKLLRNICLEKGMKIHNRISDKAVPKRALQLAGEAYKKKLYGRQENKQIINWLELVQNVAGKENYAVSAGDVQKLTKGVLGLIHTFRF